MKLRIRGNSIRLRVSQTELERIADAGFVEDRVQFAPRAALVYRLTIGGDEPRAVLDGHQLTVAVPKAAFDRWLGPDEVSILAEQPIAGADDVLKILVEKDFACLAPREGEDDSDMFPNPAKQTC